MKIYNYEKIVEGIGCKIIDREILKQVVPRGSEAELVLGINFTALSLE